MRGVGEAGLAVEGLTDGLNVLAAPNEFGKSTLFDGLRACLTVPHSHRKPVEALARDEGGSPWVQVDLTLPPPHEKAGRYRIEKRFLRDKTASVTDLATARVVCERADADAWIREAVGADPDARTAEGPLGLLWVAQGASTLAPDTASEAGAGLRALIGEEVSAVVGGPATERAVKRTEAALGEYLTGVTRNPRKQGPLGRARDEVARLEAAEARYAAAASETEALRAALVEAEDALSALQDEAAEGARRAALREAEARLAEAERMDAQLEGLRARAEQARGDRNRAAAEAAALAGRHEAARAAREKAAAAARAEKAAEEEETAKATAAERARAEAGRLEEAASEAAERLERARRQEARRAARAASARAQADLNEARAAAERLAGPAPAEPPDVLLILRLTEEARTAQAAARAERPTLTLQAGEGVTLNGAPLPAGRAVPAPSGAVLRVGGAAVLIEAPGGQAAQEAARVAREALDAALTAAGVDSYTEAKERAAEVERVRAARSEAQRTLNSRAPAGLPALEAEAERLAAEAGGEEEDAAPVEVSALAEAARSAATAAQEARRAARRAGDAAEAARRGRAELGAASLVAASQATDRADGLGDPEEWDEALATARAEATRREEAAEALARRLAGAEASLPDLTGLRAARDAAAGAIELHVGALRRADTERAGLAATLRARYDGETTAEEDLARTRGALEAARERLAEEEAEVEALELLEETLDRAREEQLAGFLAPVMAETAPLLDAVLPGAALSFTSDLALTGVARGDRAAGPGGEPFDGFDRLSGGTREQVAILVRLGFARLMAKRGRPVPVLLDDALVFADDERIERMFEAVRDAASDVQVVALSCRQRAFERLGGNAVTARPIGA